MTEPIKLPPLPEWVEWPVTVSEMSNSEIKEAMQAYATAAIEADRQEIKELLQNPVHVHTNMCRSIIAPITFGQLAHVLGEEATNAWLADRQARGEPVKCATCRDSGIIGHSDICPSCADKWKPAEPVAWGAFYFGGKRNGKLYNQSETEAQIDAYIADVHRSNDSITLRKGPLYTTPQPKQAGEPVAVCVTCSGSGMVDDGEIDCYENGEPYENGPVKCVKDCPDCIPQPQQIPEGYGLVPIEPTDQKAGATCDVDGAWQALAEVWELNAAEFKEYGDDSRAEAYNECAKELRAIIKAAPEPKEKS